MAIIPQQRLFDWQEIEELGDLERLVLVLNHMPDEKLMRHLELNRGLGRNDYPVRAMWNSVLAGVVYQHPTIESLRRELARNGQLRSLCGFGRSVTQLICIQPFSINLFDHQGLIDEIFCDLVEQCRRILPGFGGIWPWMARP